jgi:hypothetical protein
MLIDYLQQLRELQEFLFLCNLKVAQSKYEKIIDLGFRETPYIVILLR